MRRMVYACMSDNSSSITLTWDQVAAARVRSGISQHIVARELGVDQATISRLECKKAPVTDEHFYKLSGILGEALSDRPLEGSIRKMRAVQGMVVDAQWALGHMTGSVLAHLTPKNFRQALLSRLGKEKDIVWTADPHIEDKTDRALSAGVLGQRIVKADARVRAAIKEKRWDDCKLIVEPILLEVSNAPAEIQAVVAPFVAKLIHHLGMAVEIGDSDFQLARKYFDEVIAHSGADNRDKAIALYEKAFTFIEEYSSKVEMTSEVHLNLSVAARWYENASELDPTDPFMGYGLMHQADLVMRLGDEPWALRIAESAATIFKKCDITPISELLPTLPEARKRFPALASKRNFLKRILHWLGVFVIAATPFTTITRAHEGDSLNQSTASLHHGNYAPDAKALCFHHGNSASGV